MRVAKKVLTRWTRDTPCFDGTSATWAYKMDTVHRAGIRHDRRALRNLRKAIRSHGTKLNFRWTVDHEDWLRGPAFKSQ